MCSSLACWFQFLCREHERDCTVVRSFLFYIFRLRSELAHAHNYSCNKYQAIFLRAHRSVRCVHEKLGLETRIEFATLATKFCSIQEKETSVINIVLLKFLENAGSLCYQYVCRGHVTIPWPPQVMDFAPWIAYPDSQRKVTTEPGRLSLLSMRR